MPVSIPNLLRSGGWKGREAGQTDAQAAAAGATAITAADMTALDTSRREHAAELVRLAGLASAATTIVQVTQGQYDNLPKPTPVGVYYDIVTQATTDAVAAINTRLAAGDTSDFFVVGPASSGTIDTYTPDGVPNARLVVGSGGGLASGSTPGTGLAFRVPVAPTNTLVGSVVLRAGNTGWGRVRLCLDWLASDGTTVISTVAGAEGNVDSGVSSTRAMPSTAAPAGAAFARIRSELTTAFSVSPPTNRQLAMRQLMLTKTVY